MNLNEERLEEQESSTIEVLLDRLGNNDLIEIDCRNEVETVGVVNILQNQPNHNSSSLETLLIGWNSGTSISLDCVRSIANVLRVNKTITKLVFGRAVVCSDGVLAIMDALSSYDNTTLTSLEFCSDVNYTGIVAIGRMLKINTSLTDLCMMACNINSDGASVFGDSLKQNTTLKVLVLDSNNIGDVGAASIADGIKQNDSSSLNTLGLEHNHIGIVGVRSIASMLTTNKTLTRLGLGSNKMMGKEGVFTIVEALKHNISFAWLGLDEIPFGDDGARSIATLLTPSYSLTKLCLDFCNISDAGAIAISDVLKSNKSLEYLSLEGNPFSCSIISNEFAPMLEMNTTLKHLNLDGIDAVNDVVAGAILKTLEDYNDTAQIVLPHWGDSDVRLKIVEIGEQNCKGIRTAFMKATTSPS